MPVYLHLFHGRASKREKMSDWGTNGPIFGPLKFIHSTYASDIKFELAGSEDSFDLGIVDGLVYYDGMYYGDWTVFAAEGLTTDKPIPFEQIKATPAPVKTRRRSK